jgi:hypothetical protein
LVVTLDAFTQSAVQSAPPSSLRAPLQALWWARKGDWERAHKLVMDDTSGDAAWVHAYLHRVEGDLPNARYWYRQAGQPVADGALDTEWSAITQALLAQE